VFPELNRLVGRAVPPANIDLRRWRRSAHLAALYEHEESPTGIGGGSRWAALTGGTAHVGILTPTASLAGLAVALASIIETTGYGTF
jgi:hypothetical protein